MAWFGKTKEQEMEKQELVEEIQVRQESESEIIKRKVLQFVSSYTPELLQLTANQFKDFKNAIITLSSKKDSLYIYQAKGKFITAEKNSGDVTVHIPGVKFKDVWYVRFYCSNSDIDFNVKVDDILEVVDLFDPERK